MTPDTIEDVTTTKDRISRAQFMRLSTRFMLALCSIAVVLPLPFGRPGVWSALKLSDLLGWQTALSGALGIFLGVVIIALTAFWQPIYGLTKYLIGLVAWETFRTSDYFVSALMAALGEELLFRGALQPLIGLVPAAMIFGLLHATTVAHIFLAGLLGLLLGWLYQWSGTLWSPIMTHLAIDLVTGLFLARTMRPGKPTAQGD